MQNNSRNKDKAKRERKLRRGDNLVGGEDNIHTRTHTHAHTQMKREKEEEDEERERRERKKEFVTNVIIPVVVAELLKQ